MIDLQIRSLNSIRHCCHRYDVNAVPLQCIIETSLPFNVGQFFKLFDDFLKIFGSDSPGSEEKALTELLKIYKTEGIGVHPIMSGYST